MLSMRKTGTMKGVEEKFECDGCGKMFNEEDLECVENELGREAFLCDKCFDKSEFLSDVWYKGEYEE